MLTNKPISTISYNSKEYLQRVLTDLEKARIINEWYFIHHKGETDWYTEEREKDHFHVYLSPCKRIDTENLRDEFKELDPTNPTKPLGVMPFMRSNLDDWTMYGVHDVNYLNSKGEAKEFHYSWKEIVGYDDEAVKRAVKHASATAYKELSKRAYVDEHGVVEAYKRGIIKTGEVLGMMAIQKQQETEKLMEQEQKKMTDAHGFIDAKTENPFQ